MSDTAPGWTDERVETLKKLWADGLSASQCAGRLGYITRNAVIGKVHRLGLEARATSSRIASARRQGANRKALRAARPVYLKRPALPAAATARPDPVAAAFVPGELNAPLYLELLKLTDQTCRYPIGDPQKEGFGFCGNTPIPGMSYCVGHHIHCHALQGRQRK